MTPRRRSRLSMRHGGETENRGAPVEPAARAPHRCRRQPLRNSAFHSLELVLRLDVWLSCLGRRKSDALRPTSPPRFGKTGRGVFSIKPAMHPDAAQTRSRRLTVGAQCTVIARSISHTSDVGRLVHVCVSRSSNQYGGGRSPVSRRTPRTRNPNRWYRRREARSGLRFGHKRLTRACSRFAQAQ
jgi:hypothetical protein